MLSMYGETRDSGKVVDGHGHRAQGPQWSRATLQHCKPCQTSRGGKNRKEAARKAGPLDSARGARHSPRLKRAFFLPSETPHWLPEWPPTPSPEAKHSRGVFLFFLSFSWPSLASPSTTTGRAMTWASPSGLSWPRADFNRHAHDIWIWYE